MIKITTIIALLLLVTACGSKNEASESNTSNPVKPQEEVSLSTEISNQVDTVNATEVPSPETTMSNDAPVVKKQNIVRTKEVKSTNPTPSTNKEVKPSVENEVSTEIPKIDFSKVYGQLLNLYVTSNGKVNYKGLKKANELMDQAIYHFKENTPQSGWSDNQVLAYWINAYNLFTLKLVTDNYPVNSIKDIAGGKPWDKKFIQLDGKTLSLNDIENGIIRKQFKEPRIHFAVNCASISCPKLINKEYNKDNLNSLLTQQTKAYLSDKSENVITENSLNISNIFNWYKDDFSVAGGVTEFIKKYSGTDVKSNASIGFQEYNWNLNE
ncbi:MAG: DUF547 domain-containing protein [Bacteroidetes bacterium]|nr:DUF547 domain-containing protein [Bacteroidota bacterium]